MTSQYRRFALRLTVGFLVLGPISVFFGLMARYLAARWNLHIAPTAVVAIAIFAFAVFLRAFARFLVQPLDKKGEQLKSRATEVNATKNRTSEDSGHLRVLRPISSVDKYRSYKIMLDGTCLGEIGADQEVTFSVPAGSHSLSLKIDWCGSNSIAVNIQPGSIHTYAAASNIDGARVLLGFWYAIFKPMSYLRLQPDANTAHPG